MLTNFQSNLGFFLVLISFKEICIFAFTFQSAFRPSRANLQVRRAWSRPEFAYPSDAARQADIASGNYKPENIVILDVDGWKNERGEMIEFITTPSMSEGVPATLSTISKRPSNEPLLEPFPSWSWHQPRSCDKIVSVWRVQVDPQGRLWVIDTGRINQFSATSQRLCDPQVFVFDLKQNNKLIYHYKIPTAQTEPNSLFVNIALDLCNPSEPWAYFSDPVGFKLVSYTPGNGQPRSHSFKHPYMYPDPIYGFYEINGVNFTLMDGLFAATPDPNCGRDYPIYYHALTSGRQGLVKNDLLKKDDLTFDEQSQFKISKQTKPFHSTVHVMHKNMLIMADLEDNALVSWNKNTLFAEQNFRIVVKDDTNLQFPSGMKIVGDEIWVLSSRLQNVIGGSVPSNELNYRVVTVKLSTVYRA